MIFKVILYLIIIYYILKLIGRIFLPIFVTNRIRKMEEDKQKAYKEYINQKKRNEGKVTIDRVPEKSGKHNGNDGEYVDYEEIK